MGDSGASWRHDDEEDQEDEEFDETQYKSQKDAVIFAIEVSPSMLEKPSEPSSQEAPKKKRENDSPATAALKCAYELMQQRIISSPNDMIGVLLYGTAESKFLEDKARGSISHPNCYLLVDLCVPAAGDVKTLRSLVEDERSFQKLVKPSEESVSMANVLFCANQIFTTKAPNFISRRLFLVTDDDDPHKDAKDMRSAAAVRARDLYDLGVSIELFPISKASQFFDRNKFYNDIIYSQTPSDPDAPQSTAKEAKALSSGGGISLLQSLLSSIKSRAVPKRALFSLPFELGPNLRISVKGYIIFKRQEPARKSYVWLNGEKAQVVTSHSGELRSDHGGEVKKAEVRKAYKFGGAQVTFTPEEISSLRNFGDPVIRILGFKPRSMLPFWANVKNSTFVYPSEEGYVGSTRVFSALQQKMLRDDKMAIAWFIPRRNATPTIVAILAGAERQSEDDEAEQIMPPGLWIVPLPFADDIRKDPEIPHIVAPDQVVDSMRQIIQLLQLPKATYFPERYPNPALQWHYKILQAMALEEDIPEKAEDKTVPKYRQIDKRAGGHVREWAHELEKAHSQWRSENQESAAALSAIGGKRPREMNVKDIPDRSQKIKKEDGDSTISNEDMKMAWTKGKLGQFKVADLKGWLASKGIKASGKKNDLTDQVEQYFETK